MELSSRQRMRIQTTKQNASKNSREEEDEFADLSNPHSLRKKFSASQVGCCTN